MPANRSSGGSMSGRNGSFRVPPQALEIEESVLGVMMLEKEALGRVMDKLSADLFYKPAHQTIFKAISELFHEGQPVDLLTVEETLKRHKVLKEVGGVRYLSHLTLHISSSESIETHVRILTERSIKRRLIAAGRNIQSNSFEEEKDAFELLDEAQQALFEIHTQLHKEFVPLEQVIRQTLEEIKHRQDTQADGLTGVPSGFKRLDRMTGGWQASDLVIVASRPGMGKTSFAMSLLRNAAYEFKLPCAIFSLEMTAPQLVMRLLSSEMEINGERLKTGKYTEEEWMRITAAAERLSNVPLFVDDTSALSMMELRAKARRLREKEKIQLLVIDYLQLMRPDMNMGRQSNREQEIAYISRTLKALAKELDIPIIALAQLNRAVVGRKGQRPILSDIRESGAIEQDADMVMFIHRPEAIGLTEDDSGQSNEGIAELIIAKHRHGATDTIELQFVKEYTKFKPLSEGPTTYPSGANPPDSDEEELPPAF